MKRLNYPPLAIFKLTARYIFGQTVPFADEQTNSVLLEQQNVILRNRQTGPTINTRDE